MANLTKERLEHLRDTPTFNSEVRLIAKELLELRVEVVRLREKRPR